jgi:hypothetical protein
MIRLTLDLSPMELMALGFCTSAGLELAKQRKEPGMQEAIENLAEKILRTKKPPVPDYGQ